MKYTHLILFLSLILASSAAKASADEEPYVFDAKKHAATEAFMGEVRDLLGQEFGSASETQKTQEDLFQKVDELDESTLNSIVTKMYYQAPSEGSFIMPLCQKLVVQKLKLAGKLDSDVDWAESESMPKILEKALLDFFSDVSLKRPRRISTTSGAFHYHMYDETIQSLLLILQTLGWQESLRKQVYAILLKREFSLEDLSLEDLVWMRKTPGYEKLQQLILTTFSKETALHHDRIPTPDGMKFLKKTFYSGNLGKLASLLMELNDEGLSEDFRNVFILKEIGIDLPTLSDLDWHSEAPAFEALKTAIRTFIATAELEIATNNEFAGTLGNIQSSFFLFYQENDPLRQYVQTALLMRYLELDVNLVDGDDWKEEGAAQDTIKEHIVNFIKDHDLCFDLKFLKEESDLTGELGIFYQNFSSILEDIPSLSKVFYGVFLIKLLDLDIPFDLTILAPESPNHEVFKKALMDIAMQAPILSTYTGKYAGRLGVVTRALSNLKEGDEPLLFIKDASSIILAREVGIEEPSFAPLDWNNGSPEYVALEKALEWQLASCQAASVVDIRPKNTLANLVDLFANIKGNDHPLVQKFGNG